MLIVGTGGQGLITLLQIIAQAAFIDGNDVRTSELHGLSQRGGSVDGHIRFGRKIYSPLISQGEANLILGLEMQESLRVFSFANEKTFFLLNQEIIPIPLTQTPTENEILENFKKVNLSFYTIPAGKICQEKLGNKVVSGIFLVSLASFKNLIPINPDSLLEAIEKVISKDHLDLNIKAFNLASQYAKKE